jgi:hypothetical protein
LGGEPKEPVAYFGGGTLNAKRAFKTPPTSERMVGYTEVGFFRAIIHPSVQSACGKSHSAVLSAMVRSADCLEPAGEEDWREEEDQMSKLHKKVLAGQ